MSSATGAMASSTPVLRASCSAACTSCMKAWKCTRRTPSGPAAAAKSMSISIDLPRPTPPQR